MDKIKKEELIGRWANLYASENFNWDHPNRLNDLNPLLLASYSNDENTFLLPMAMKVSAQTVGLDLVSVQPLSSPSLKPKDRKLLKEAENVVLITNRHRKLENLLYNKEYIPIKIEDTEQYKKYLNSGG